MDNTRLNKISRLVQKELGEIFREQTQSLHGVLVSVTSVRVSPDLSIARVNLSIFPGDKSKDILENITKQGSQVRFALGNRIGKQLRRIPELYFYIDDSLDYLERIDELLKK